MTMLRVINWFALLVDGTVLLYDQSFAQPSTDRAVRSVSGCANGFALTSDRAALLIDSAALQRVQNSAAWIVLQAPRLSHTKPLLRQLHWLPVQHRIMLCAREKKMFFILVTSRVMLIPNYFARRQTKDTVCTHCCPNKHPKKLLSSLRSRGHSYTLPLIEFSHKLVCKQMFICYDLTTVLWLYEWHSTYFFMYYSWILFFVLLFIVHLCANTYLLKLFVTELSRQLLASTAFLLQRLLSIDVKRF